MSRSGVLFLLHDHCWRWWQKGSGSQVPGRVHANPQGQLYALARCPGSEFPGCPYPVPDCKFIPSMGVVHRLIMPLAAICVFHRYCVDSIPFLDQLGRRGVIYSDTMMILIDQPLLRTNIDSSVPFCSDISCCYWAQALYMMSFCHSFGCIQIIIILPSFVLAGYNKRIALMGWPWRCNLNYSLCNTQK